MHRSRRHFIQRPQCVAAYRGQLTLDSSLRLTAHWAWERRLTAKLAELPFGEETITETILLDLATQHPREISVFPFHSRMEGRTGADWGWCFHDSAAGRFTRMLVQAKVLDARDQTYARLDRTIGNTSVRQIDRLLETARQRRCPALYAFYNHLSDASRVPSSVCTCFGCLQCWGFLSLSLTLSASCSAEAESGRL